MKKIFGIIAIITIVLSGCASYNATRMPSADVMSFSNHQEEDNLYVAVKFFNSNESKNVFGVSDVYNKYQPVYIAIDNKTKNTYEFYKSMLNVTSTPAEEVANKCGFNTAGRAVAYGIPGLLIWPFLIPAVVDGIGSSNANEKMNQDYSDKEITDGRIPPSGLLNGVMFLKKMKPCEDLTIKLKNVENGEIKVFNFKK